MLKPISMLKKITAGMHCMKANGDTFTICDVVPREQKHLDTHVRVIRGIQDKEGIDRLGSGSYDMKIDDLYVYEKELSDFLSFQRSAAFASDEEMGLTIREYYAGEAFKVYLEENSTALHMAARMAVDAADTLISELVRTKPRYSDAKPVPTCTINMQNTGFEQKKVSS